MTIIQNDKRHTIYPSLYGLRAISILIVIFGHLNYKYKLFYGLSSDKILQPFVYLFTDSQFGVNVFFVISGFLITALLLEEEKKNKHISLKKFYLRRILRIFPAYYFYLFVIFLLQIFGVVFISNESWLTAITYTKYFNWSLDWLTGHAWSLSVEEQFYLFWPIIFLFNNKVRKYCAFIVIALVILLKIYTYYYPISWMNDLTLFRRIDAIAIGCLIAMYKNELLNRLQPNLKFLFYCSIIGILLLIYLSSISSSLNLNLQFLTAILGTTTGSISNLFIGVIMLYSVFGNHGFWFKLLNSSILTYIGLLSYSLYLWQQLYLSGMDLWIFQFPQNILLFVITAMFSYYCIEKPFLRLKNKCY